MTQTDVDARDDVAGDDAAMPTVSALKPEGQHEDAGAREADWQPLDLGPGGSRGVARIAEYQRLRAECPVAWASDFGGYWSLMKYKDVAEAARQHKRFRSGQVFAAMPGFQPIPQGTNPPEHTTYRRALNKYFGPARMHALEPTIRRAASEQLEPLLERGSADMVREFASIVPVRGLAALLNLSDGAWIELLERFEALTALQDPAKVSEAVMGTLGEAMTRVVADRRAHPLDPDTDLVSGVLEMKVDGESLSDDAVAAIGVQIFAAGHGTTTDGMSGCLYHLATSPDDQAALRRDPSLIPDAIEEFLRLEPSGHEFTRHATEDVEIRGCPISSGDLVALNIASANRDEDEFPHAGACIIDRKPNRHLSFGNGVHKCLGAPLARLELRVALEELLRQTKAITLDGPAVEVSAFYFLGGFTSLPVRLHT